uniref:Uncharacterized protein n=1 Tax=Cacopsylla melanoneura TaxID=428564 RepID=A0A8D9EA24_9HEMI
MLVRSSNLGPVVITFEVQLSGIIHEYEYITIIPYNTNVQCDITKRLGSSVVSGVIIIISSSVIIIISLFVTLLIQFNDYVLIPLVLFLSELCHQHCHHSV